MWKRKIKFHFCTCKDCLLLGRSYISKQPGGLSKHVEEWWNRVAVSRWRHLKKNKIIYYNTVKIFWYIFRSTLIFNLHHHKYSSSFGVWCSFLKILNTYTDDKKGVHLSRSNKQQKKGPASFYLYYIHSNTYLCSRT